MAHTPSGACSQLFRAVLISMCAASLAGADVYTVSDVGSLHYYVSTAQSGDEVVINPGTYVLQRGLQMNATSFTIRGATGNRDDVVLVGGGMNTRGVDEGILMNTDNLTVSDLTLRDFYFNAIHIRAESDADNLVIRNVKIMNVGERHIKGSRGAIDMLSDNVLIERSYLVQTMERSGHPDSSPDYIGGIDAMNVNNWTIRDNVFEGIHGSGNEGNAAIFLWNGVQNVTIERNVLLGNAKGIGIGLGPGGSGMFTAPYHARDIIIRNNFMVRGPWNNGNNIGLELGSVKDVKVYSNTLYSPNAGYFRMISPWDSAASAIDNLDFKNNIIRGGVYDLATGGDWTVQTLADMGNIVDNTGAIIDPSWFVAVDAGDLHLTAAAQAAIDAGVVLADVPFDFDGQARDATPDMGADELPEPATLALLAAGIMGLLARRRAPATC